MLRRRHLLAAAALAPAGWPTSIGAAPPGVADTRAALLIGNSRYAGASLKNATADARLLESVAGELGFRTTLLLDASMARTLDALRVWLLASSGASTRLFFFAGHGAQYRGRNYLIPTDAELRSEDDLPGRAIDASDLADRMARARHGVNLIVLDACRSLPMLQPPAGARLRAGGGNPPSPGLAPMPAPRGTLVAYSTAPGALSADDPASTNSPYTRHLAVQLRVPRLSIETVFKRTRAAVLQDSGGTQTPWETSSLVGEVCLACSGQDGPDTGASRTTTR